MAEHSPDEITSEHAEQNDGESRVTSALIFGVAFFLRFENCP